MKILRLVFLYLSIFLTILFTLLANYQLEKGNGWLLLADVAIASWNVFTAIRLVENRRTVCR